MTQFVDEAVIHVRAGRGGNGAVSFRREAHTPRGGPDGGDGGRGGDVVLEVSTEAFDLSALARNPHQRAGHGSHGQGGIRRGRDGADLVLPVPDGTVAREERGLVADLVGEGARALVARGGRGGRGNASLASPRNKAPRAADPGEPGEEHRLDLELRLVADVALVGLPNAGKSTLLTRLTSARPRVAAYPFTTLTPNLGVIEEDTRLVMADVPGLIEDAHRGKGLGDRFLRHVSRCRALAYVVDVSAADPVADLLTVRREVEAYDSHLAARPWLVVATKRDLIGADELASRVGALSAVAETLAVSGTTGERIDALSERLLSLAASAKAPARDSHVVLRPGRELFTVRKLGGRRFRVEGPVVERWVRHSDLEDPRQVIELQERLRRAGVEKRLGDEGAREGDEVVIAGRAFEYFPETKGDDGG